MKFVRLAKLTLFLLAFFFLLGASGDQARFNDLGHRMICSCGCNQILLECNHVGCPLSDKMRNQLMNGIQRGDADNLILQSFVQEYGLTVLAAPVNSGFGRVAWVTPFLIFIAGLLVVIFVVRNWRLRPATVEAGGTQKLPYEQLLTYKEQARRETDL